MRMTECKETVKYTRKLHRKIYEDAVCVVFITERVICNTDTPPSINLDILTTIRVVRKDTDTYNDICINTEFGSGLVVADSIPVHNLGYAITVKGVSGIDGEDTYGLRPYLPTKELRKFIFDRIILKMLKMQLRIFRPKIILRGPLQKWKLGNYRYVAIDKLLNQYGYTTNVVSVVANQVTYEINKATRIPNFTITNALFCPYKITSVNNMCIWYSGVEYSYGKLTGMVKHARYIN